MTLEKRRVVAYLAARIASSRNLLGVYDKTTESWSPFTSAITPQHLSVYDHDRDSMVIVTGPLGDLYIYDCKSGRHIKMQLKGGNFTGYDFERMAYFYGSVYGSSIFLCDFQLSDYFNFSTQPPPPGAKPRKP